MEESSSASESSAGQSASDTEKDTYSSFMLYFASNYGKLYRQINVCRNQHEKLKTDCSNCEAAVHKKLDELETSISQNTKEIQSMLYLFEGFSKRIESIEKDIAQLKISVDSQEQADISPKSISAWPSL